ncbi:MAG: hypothetical protein KJ634_08575 [Gammaproteobacteria bacterium]|nr:hypothetical protein [Gammaproteobacteria bacterium]MBU1415659.1 hypothetical protein [Gammaproteobacteria bacterium]
MSTHREFLETTYRALRDGALGPLSSTYADVSHISLEGWLADPYLNSPALSDFLRLYPPGAGEFLVSLKVEHGRVLLLATNLRLWMQAKDRALVCLRFAELSSYEARSKFGWNHVVTVRMKSGETKTVAGVPMVLPVDLANFLISGTALEPASAAETTDDLEIAESNRLPRGFVGIAAFALYMFLSWSKMEDAGSVAIVLLGGVFLAFGSEQFYRATYGSSAKSRRRT